MMKQELYDVCFGSGVMAVAVININDDKPFDWGAYIGVQATGDQMLDREHIAKHGVKLTKKVAEAIFPFGGIVKYRD